MFSVAFCIPDTFFPLFLFVSCKMPVPRSLIKTRFFFSSFTTKILAYADFHNVEFLLQSRQFLHETVKRFHFMVLLLCSKSYSFHLYRTISEESPIRSHTAWKYRRVKRRSTFSFCCRPRRLRHGCCSSRVGTAAKCCAQLDSVKNSQPSSGQVLRPHEILHSGCVSELKGLTGKVKRNSEWMENPRLFWSAPWFSSQRLLSRDHGAEISVGLLDIASVINMNYNQGKGNHKNMHVKMNSDSHLLKPASIRSFRNIFFYQCSVFLVEVGHYPDLSQADTFCIPSCSKASVLRVAAALRLDVRMQGLFCWGKLCFPTPHWLQA